MSGELPEQEAKGIPLTRQTDEADESGLVICAISDRRENASQFITAEQIESLVSESFAEHEFQAEHKLPYFQIAFSPGSIRVSKHDPNRIGVKSENWKPRKSLTEWSAKSRVKMLERFSSLDYSPFEINGSMLAFLTLTYPSEWEIVVPSASHAKNHLHSLRKRFQREFHRPLFALWKMEFQRRGAPHFHLLAPIPNGHEFRDWLSRSWTEIVNHPSETERAKHLLAGTGIDKAKGLSANTASRVSFYFSKHASPNRGSKEYQNTPPRLWIESGSVGRFWGYWGLETASKKITVSDPDALLVSRTLRRWQRANTKPKAVIVWRTNLRTGVVSKRRVVRRPKFPRSAQSLRLVPNAEKFIAILGRVLDTCRLG